MALPVRLPMKILPIAKPTIALTFILDMASDNKTRAFPFYAASLSFGKLLINIEKKSDIFCADFLDIPFDS